MNIRFGRHLVLLGLLGGSSWTWLPLPTVAQVTTAQTNTGTTLVFGLNEAKNLARQAAEQANGGLGNYRAEPSMHGDPQFAPYVENTDGSYTFTFKGRYPNTLEYIYETQVTVFPNSTVKIDYNGAIRTEQSQTNPTQMVVDLNQAKNLARQAAEQANGGLGNYRAEASMHGDARRSPYVENADGSYTFTFKGRKPDAMEFTYETVVQVTPQGETTMLYNGAVRQTAAATQTGTATVDLNQAKNLARQAAEQANGGLGHYRAEPAMHGNPNNAPYVENPDGSLTFTFKGRRPESLDYTYSSVVQVYPDGRVTILSNQTTP